MSTQFDNFFYFSSMYSDRLLTEFLPEAKNRAYQRYMEIQKNLLNGEEYHGIFGNDFHTSFDLNNMFGFKADSVYCPLEGFVLPIVNKLAFMRKFGNGIIDIRPNDFNDPIIFNKTFHFTIGNFTFDNYHILMDRTHRIWIGIENDANDGINHLIFKKLKDMNWFFWSDRSSAKYDGFVSMMTDFDTVNIEDGRINFTITPNKLTNLSIPTEENLWSISMTGNLAEFGKYLLYTSDAYLVGIDNDKLTFSIREEFYNFIKRSNATVYTVLTHKPYKRFVYMYSGTEHTLPIIYMDDNGNPIPSTNIKVYNYDASNGNCKDRISLADLEPEYFPAIYNLSSLTSDDIFLEITDYPDDQTKSTFDNHFAELINRLGSAGYRNSIVSGDLSRYPSIVEYNPANIKYDYKDFLESPYSDNLREYKLHKLIDLINSDSWLYMEYLKFMNRINNEGWVEAGTPKHYMLNTGLGYTLTYSAKPTVMDNSIVADRTGKRKITFDEPHTYLKLNCENEEVYVRLFINGQLIYPTLVCSVTNETYVFVSQSVLQKYLRSYNPIEADYEDGLITAKEAERRLATAQPIIVEVYPKMDRTLNTRKYSTFIAGNTSDYIKLFDGLIEERITTPILDGCYVYGMDQDIEYLYTNLAEKYLTQDNEAIILEKTPALIIADDLNTLGKAHYTTPEGNVIYLEGHDAVFNWNNSVTYTREIHGGLSDYEVCLNDLVFYNISTDQYLTMDQFDFLFTLHRADLEFDDGITFQVKGMEDDVQYLFTHAGQLYETQDLQSIILDEHSEELSPVFNPDAPADSAEPRSYHDIANKMVKLKDLKIKIKDAAILGCDIGVCINRSAQEWDIDFDDDEVSVENNVVKITLNDFFGNPDPECVELYLNGVMVPQTNKSVGSFSVQMPELTHGSIVIQLSRGLSDYVNQMPSTAECKFKIQYLAKKNDNYINFAKNTYPTTIRPERSTSNFDHFYLKKFCNMYTYRCYDYHLGKISTQWYDENGNLCDYLLLAGDSHSIYGQPLDLSYMCFHRTNPNIKIFGFTTVEYNMNFSGYKQYLTLKNNHSAEVYVATEPNRDCALEGLITSWPLNDYLEA